MKPSAISAAGANRTPEPRFRRSGTIVPLGPRISRACRAIWPDKTDKNLAAVTGNTDRAARKLLAGQCGLSLGSFGALLHSDDGLLFLEAIMGDAAPTWWRGFKRQARLSAVRRTQEELRIEIERLERSAADLTD